MESPHVYAVSSRLSATPSDRDRRRRRSLGMRLTAIGSTVALIGGVFSIIAITITPTVAGATTTPVAASWSSSPNASELRDGKPSGRNRLGHPHRQRRWRRRRRDQLGSGRQGGGAGEHGSRTFPSPTTPAGQRENRCEAAAAGSLQQRLELHRRDHRSRGIRGRW